MKCILRGDHLSDLIFSAFLNHLFYWLLIKLRNCSAFVRNIGDVWLTADWWRASPFSFQFPWTSSSEISVSNLAVSVSVTSTLYSGRTTLMSRSAGDKGRESQYMLLVTPEDLQQQLQEQTFMINQKGWLKGTLVSQYKQFSELFSLLFPFFTHMFRRVCWGDFRLGRNKNVQKWMNFHRNANDRPLHS